MNVLHVLTKVDPKQGGVSQAVLTMSFGLKQLGVHSEITCLDSPEDQFVKEYPSTIHALGPAKGPWAHSDKLVPWLLENLARFNVVILHGLWQYHGYAVLKAINELKRRKVNGQTVPKLFVMPHGMLDPYFQRAAGRKLKAIRNVIYWKLIERRVVNQADGLLFTCEEERNLARKTFSPYRPKKELVIGLGVEEPPEHRSSMMQSSVAENKSYLLFLSRIHEKKGVDQLLEGFSRTLPSNFATDALVVAGPGLESAYGEKLKSFVRSVDALSTVVEFPGMLSGDSKWAAFYGCEAFILPSHQENFGIAVVEALACGKPVLISNQINIWREIQLAGAGIVADDTVDGVVALLEKWGKLSSAERKAMGSRARALYVKNFSVHAAAESCVQAISKS